MDTTNTLTQDQLLQARHLLYQMTMMAVQMNQQIIILANGKTITIPAEHLAALAADFAATKIRLACALTPTAAQAEPLEPTAPEPEPIPEGP
jgi:hypothetical protein